MLVQYYPLANLTPEEWARLRALNKSVFESAEPYIIFENKYISKAELQSWGRTQVSGRQILNG